MILGNRCNGARCIRAFKLEHKVILGTCFWTVRNPLRFWNCLPQCINDGQRLSAVLGNVAVYEPATNQCACSSDTASTMNRGYSSSTFVILQHIHNLMDKLQGCRETPIPYREAVVFDGGGVNSLLYCALSQNFIVRLELPALRQVNKSAYARSEQRVDFGIVLLPGIPWKLASE